MEEQPDIFDAVQAMNIVEKALLYDESPISPTITLRTQLKRVLRIADRVGLFTWYESLGVFLLNIREG